MHDERAVHEPRSWFRVAGLPVAVDWSVLVIAALLAWGLADTILPRMAPGHGRAAYWLAAIVGAVLLLCSVLAHELAHALVARRSGVEVERLTLWLFGGIATLRGEPQTPGADFTIAAVGPATSAGIGVGFAASSFALAAVGAGELAIGVAVWLALVNVVLAGFNLIPGAPLDGGRVLRAFLWHRWGDRARAAATATAAGQAVAAGLVVLAALSFVLGDTVGALWLVLVGWFVHTAARAERASTLVSQVLAGVPVSAVMSRDVRTGPADLSVDEFVDAYLLSGRHSAYPVVERNGLVIGLVTLAQLRAVPAPRRPSTMVRDVCLPLARVAVASPGEPLVELLPRLTRDSGGRALVYAEGHLVGLVTPVDVARAIETRRLAAR